MRRLGRTNQRHRQPHTRQHNPTLTRFRSGHSLARALEILGPSAAARACVVQPPKRPSLGSIVSCWSQGHGAR